MSTSPEIARRILPEYDNPPVVEVAISLQFKPLDLLRAAHFGLFWQAIREEGFSYVEDHGELPPVFEDLEAHSSRGVGVRLQTFEDAPPLPRVWFLNKEQNELIQLQRDRLVVNWRQGVESGPYLHYVNILKRFKFAIEALRNLTRSASLEAIVPNQCEITYINHIPAELEWSSLGELPRIVTVWENQYSDDYLPVPEDVGFFARYRMNDEEGCPLGRLNVAFQPGYQKVDGGAVFVMNVTARGKPDPPTIEGALSLFDREHEWIVRGFTSITTPNMHEFWRRKDDR